MTWYRYVTVNVMNWWVNQVSAFRLVTCASHIHCMWNWVSHSVMSFSLSLSFCVHISHLVCPRAVLSSSQRCLNLVKRIVIKFNSLRLHYRLRHVCTTGNHAHPVTSSVACQTPTTPLYLFRERLKTAADESINNWRLATLKISIMIQIMV